MSEIAIDRSQLPSVWDRWLCWALKVQFTPEYARALGSVDKKYAKVSWQYGSPEAKVIRAVELVR
jgi:hypothetical protein